MLIYILEDDDNIRELETYALQNSGYETQGFAEPKYFHTAIQKQLPDLILLDMMLPDEDGLTVLQSLKGHTETSMIPIIIVSAKSTEIDTVKGLDSGADDYICKPFGVMELLSRVKARLRNAVNEDSYSCHNIVLSSLNRTVTSDNQQIELTYKEFELLKLFLSRPGVVYTREVLMQRIWGYTCENSVRTLDVHINSLRRKLKEKGALIVTVRNVGYKLKKGD